MDLGTVLIGQKRTLRLDLQCALKRPFVSSDSWRPGESGQKGVTFSDEVEGLALTPWSERSFSRSALARWRLALKTNFPQRANGGFSIW